MSALRSLGNTAPAMEGHSLQLRRRQVSATVTISFGEIARRDEVGLGAVTDAVLLGVLATLPVGEPFDWSMLDRRAQRVLGSAPPGVVERVGNRAVRLLIPAVTVEAVAVQARVARPGLEAASTFAPFCRRTAVLPEAAVDADVLVEAAYYGIGVCARFGGVTRVAAEPAPFVVRRSTSALWQFHEEAWVNLRSLSAQRGLSAGQAPS